MVALLAGHCSKFASHSKDTFANTHSKSQIYICTRTQWNGRCFPHRQPIRFTIQLAPHSLLKTPPRPLPFSRVATHSLSTIQHPTPQHANQRRSVAISSTPGQQSTRHCCCWCCHCHCALAHIFRHICTRKCIRMRNAGSRPKLLWERRRASPELTKQHWVWRCLVGFGLKVFSTWLVGLLRKLFCYQ